MTAPARTIYSSTSGNWPTPREFYDRLDSEFGFTLDVCASVANHKAPEFYALDHPDADRRDGLARDWAADAGDGAVWMNPPYGRGIATWMTKARQAAATGATVVGLVPVRADASWWHEHVLTAGAEVRYVRGRLTFDGVADAAPFASAVVIYRPSDVRDTAGPVATVPAEAPAPMTLPGHASPDTTVEDATADLLASYTPQALTAEQWAAAGDAVRTLIMTAHPTTLGVARTLLSVVTGLLAHTDAWDKTNPPRWSDILTDAVIDRYVTSHQRGATRGIFRSELRQLARGAGTIPRRAHTPCIRPVDPDPTLLAAATEPIPVAAYPALWTAAHGRRMPVEKLVPVIAELARQAKQAKATARARHTITVWSLPAPIRELAEANDQPVRETVTSTGGTTTRATRPLSRRAVKAHAHAQRAAREARTGTGTIPTAPAIDAPIQAVIDAYRPWLKVRGTWDANLDVAHRLVTGFNPASARAAQHACSYIAKFLHWYAGHAGRNPQQPITLEELTKPGLVDTYITAYTGTDKSKATMRSALRGRSAPSPRPGAHPSCRPASSPRRTRLPSALHSCASPATSRHRSSPPPCRSSSAWASAPVSTAATCGTSPATTSPRSTSTAAAQC